MANTFQIAPINPIRLVKITTENPRYFYPPFDGALQADQIPDFQERVSYFQKFTTLDTTKIQVLSDFDDIVVNIYDENGYIVIPAIPVVEKATVINQTFKVYEVEFDFSALSEGFYFVGLSYTNELAAVVEYQSEPIEVRDEHENTVLIEYKNSVNDFSVAFDTGIEFSLRVEASIQDFKPESDREVYNDQIRNVTLLNAVPYRTFTAYFGFDRGLPNWMADKLNFILCCNTVKYDGEYYQPVDGAKFEAKRADEYPFAGWTIDLAPVENKFIQQLLTGALPPQGFTVVEKAKNYFANTGDITIASVFKKYSLMKNISIINNGGAFILTVGTTNGGDEIGVFEIPAGNSNQLVNILFGSASTVYLTGLTGTSTDIMINYLQYDEDPAGGLNTNDLDKVPIGACIEYEEPEPGDLLLDFDLSTGLGTVGRRYEKYAIRDGRNGTQNRGGKIPIGYIKDDAELGELGIEVGSNEYTLAVGQLPKFHVKLFANQVVGEVVDPTANNQVAYVRNTGGDFAYGLKGSSSAATLGRSSEVGNNESIDNRQLSVVSLFIKKIA